VASRHRQDHLPGDIIESVEPIAETSTEEISLSCLIRRLTGPERRLQETRRVSIWLRQFEFTRAVGEPV
jgi:hypothetical protein